VEKKPKQTTENYNKDIRRKTRYVFYSEQKITNEMEAHRGDQSVSELFRKYAISQTILIDAIRSL